MSRASYFQTHRQVRDFDSRVNSNSDLDPYREMGFGVSSGVAAGPDDGQSLGEVMGTADQRMYVAKARVNKERHARVAEVKSSRHASTVRLVVSLFKKHQGSDPEPDSLDSTTVDSETKV